MGQVHHEGAPTTAAVRRAIQDSQESLRGLARRHGINPRTVAKGKKRASVQDKRTGPKEGRAPPIEQSLIEPDGRKKGTPPGLLAGGAKAQG
jgi:transposase-like protein